ncbi:HAD-IA family hydrolase [Luteococcus sp. Sow4_B9]|uniref:HAD-IA family hydrolase n=1 Tax=Luteococcus sp. Sow4_B9 TaxID=3438792 RepID=UPI003F9DA28F
MQKIIVDLGGVLVSETTQVRDAAKALGVAPHEITRRYWSERDAWDRGDDDLAYWGAVAEGAGVTITAAIADQLARHDSRLWTTLRPDAFRLLVDLADQGREVWVLSNAAACFNRAIAESEWSELVRGWFVSGALGMVKPDDEIYRHVEDALGVAGEELAFVDDRPENVAAARERGWTTHLWESDVETRKWLVGLGVLEG